MRLRFAAEAGGPEISVFGGGHAAGLALVALSAVRIK